MVYIVECKLNKKKVRNNKGRNKNFFLNFTFYSKSLPFYFDNITFLTKRAGSMNCDESEQTVNTYRLVLAINKLLQNATKNFALVNKIYLFQIQYLREQRQLTI